MPNPPLPRSPADLAAIAERAEQATEGPWEHVESSNGHYVSAPNGVVAAVRLPCPEGSVYLREEDAAFIAAARSDVPALLRHIAALEAERDGLRQRVAEMIMETRE